MNSSTKRLLVLLLALVAIKLVVMPIIEWQSEQVESLQGHENRIAKAKSILEEQAEMENALSTSKTLLTDIENQFPQYVNSGVFRLETQKRFETLIKEHGLEVKQVFWRDNEDVLVSGSLYRAKLSIRLAGEVHYFLPLQLALEQKQLSNQLKGLSLQLRNSSATSAGNLKGLITFDVYYYRRGKL